MKYKKDEQYQITNLQNLELVKYTWGRIMHISLGKRSPVLKLISGRNSNL